MTLLDIIILAVLAVSLALACLRIRKKGACGCAGGCKGCASAGYCSRVSSASAQKKA